MKISDTWVQRPMLTLTTKTRDDGIGARSGLAGGTGGAGNFRRGGHRELCAGAGPTVARTWRAAKLHVQKESARGSGSAFKGDVEGVAGWAGAAVELTPNRHVADGKAQGASEVTVA